MTSFAPINIAQVPGQQGKLTGIACGMGAGALWGLVFLAPELEQINLMMTLYSKVIA
jgi:L-serine deaminase